MLTDFIKVVRKNGDIEFSFCDSYGTECSLEFYGEDGELVELILWPSEFTGECTNPMGSVFTREQALELAHLIMENCQ